MPVRKTTKAKEAKPDAAPEPTNYVSEKLGKVLEDIGSQYGESLQNELFTRLERTIGEFNDEVNDMIEELKKRSVERQEKLHDLWEQRDAEPEPAKPAEAGEEAPAESAREMSEWERRLEQLENK